MGGGAMITAINTGRLDRLVERGEAEGGEADSPRPQPLELPLLLQVSRGGGVQGGVGAGGEGSGSSSSSSSPLHHHHHQQQQQQQQQQHFWVSTGCSPQCLFVNLKVKWLIRRVTLRCEGVTSVLLCIDGHRSNKFGTSSRLSDETFFVFDLMDVPSEDPGGVVGRALGFTFVAADVFVVHDLQIKAVSVREIADDRDRERK